LLPLSPTSSPSTAAWSAARGCGRPWGRVLLWPDELCAAEGRINQLLSRWPDQLLATLARRAPGGRASPSDSSSSPPLEAESMSAAVESHLWRMEIREWRSDSCPELLNPGVRAPLLSSPTYACVRLHGSSPSGAATRDSTTGRRRSCLHRRAPPLLFSPAHHCLRAAEEVSGSRSWPGGALAKPAQAETSSPSVSSYAAQTPPFAQLKPG
jgi:hypothetical protein